MKKGIKIAFLGTILTLMCGFGLFHQKANVVFAEGESTSEVAFVEKVYNYEDENGNMVLTLTSETEFSLTMTPKEGDPTTGTGTYTRDGNIITLIVGEKEMNEIMEQLKLTKKKAILVKSLQLQPIQICSI